MGASNFGNSGSGYDSTGSMGSTGTTGSTGSTGSTGGSGTDSYGSTFETGTSTVANTDRDTLSTSASGSTSGSSSMGGTSSQSDTEVPMERAKETMKQGMNAASDAFDQLQSKASELTSRLIDNIDVDDLTRRLEEQVREHPTRTLLVAVGAGFLLGRAAKR